jgi:hypothetical protein
VSLVPDARQAGIALLFTLAVVIGDAWSGVVGLVTATEYPIDSLEIRSAPRLYGGSKHFTPDFVARSGAVVCSDYGSGASFVNSRELHRLEQMAEGRRGGTIKVSKENPDRCWIDSRWQNLASRVFFAWIAVLAMVVLYNGWRSRL